jgi:hypothetical protein
MGDWAIWRALDSGCCWSFFEVSELELGVPERDPCCLGVEPEPRKTVERELSARDLTSGATSDDARAVVTPPPKPKSIWVSDRFLSGSFAKVTGSWSLARESESTSAERRSLLAATKDPGTFFSLTKPEPPRSLSEVEDEEP